MSATFNKEAVDILRAMQRSFAQMERMLAVLIDGGALTVNTEATTEDFGGQSMLDVQDRQTRRQLERVIDLLERAELRAFDPTMTGVR